MQPKARSQTPYVGPRPFETRDEDRFFGRDREATTIMHLTLAHRYVLLYAASGAGKTSLVNAKLIPLLKNKGCEVLPVARVSGSLPSKMNTQEISNIFVFHAVSSLSESSETERQLERTPLSELLSERPRRTDEDGFPLHRVLIFDQFEELFTSSVGNWQERQGFFEQVRRALDDDPLLHVIFAMREEYIARLDSYVHLLPERLRTRFPLERLKKDAALEAITGPLRKAGLSFAKGVAEKLVTDLMRVPAEIGAEGIEPMWVVGEYVEPVQLQVVCSNLWRDLPSDVTRITEGHLQEFGDVNQALSDFYEQSVRQAAKVASVNVEKLRRWFEKKLITPAGTRGTVFREQKKTAGMTNSAVDALERLHLIYGEWRARGRWYELIHDRFVEPIRTSNEAWRRVRFRRQMISTAIVCGMIMFALLGVWSRQEYKRELKARIDVARELARASMAVTEEVDLAALLAIESVRRALTDEGAESLRRAVVRLPPWTLRQRLSLDAPGKAVTFGLAGFWIATVDKAGVSVVDLDSGDSVELYHGENVALVAFSQNRMKLAIASSSPIIRQSSGGSKENTSLVQTGSVQVWDIDSQEPIGQTLSLNGSVTAIAFGPDDRSLAIGCSNRSGNKPINTVSLWNIDEQPPIPLPQSASVTAVAFNADGETLAWGSSDSNVHVWDPANGKEIALLPHGTPVTTMAFSPDGKYLATASEDTVMIWNLNNEKVNALSCKAPIGAIAFSPEGTRLAIADLDRTVRLWDVDTTREITVLPQSAPVTAVAFNSDGTSLAAIGTDDTVSVWELSSYRTFKMLTDKGSLGIAGFSADGNYLAIAGRDKTTCVWDLSTEEQIAGLKGDAPVLAVGFGPDESSLTTVTSSTVSKWTLRTVRLLASSQYGDQLRFLALGPNMDLFATVNPNNEVCVHRLSIPEQLVLLPHTDLVTAAVFSPDSSFLATTSVDRTARVWDVATGHPIASLLQTDSVIRVGFSTDSERFVTIRADRRARVWTLTDLGKPVVLPHKAVVRVVAFDPEGPHLATASLEKTVWIWDIISGKSVSQLIHDARVNDISYSYDGSYLATACDDGMVQVWNPVTAAELARLPHEDAVTSVAFRPDEEYITTVSSDGSLSLWAWQWGPEELTAEGCSRISRNFTQEEWKRYFPDEPYRCTCENLPPCAE